MKIENIKMEPKWNKSKEEVWNEVFEGLEDDSTSNIKEMNRPRRPIWLYIAASIAALVIILPSIAFFYSKNEIAPRGTHLTVTLPDGSTVNLNAESEINYKPLWWFVSRNVKMKGEAYFEVKKGSTFNVHSEQFKVSVLGTSFNILSRPGKFNVTCLTGKVSVTDKSQFILLTPDMQALWESNRLITNNLDNANETINWKDGKFVFNRTPLKEVIHEIERQYDIEIFTTSNTDQQYSGNFPKLNDPNDVLKIVGTPFGIEFKIVSK